MNTERVESVLSVTAERLSTQIAASQNADQLVEIVVHLRLLMPIFDAAGMLDSVTSLRNKVRDRAKHLYECERDRIAPVESHYLIALRQLVVGGV